MMKAKCKHYKHRDGYECCTGENCPGLLLTFCYCENGFIYIDWIRYIIYSTKCHSFFDFKDIIYDES